MSQRQSNRYRLYQAPPRSSRFVASQRQGAPDAPKQERPQVTPAEAAKATQR